MKLYLWEHRIDFPRLYSCEQVTSVDPSTMPGLCLLLSGSTIFTKIPFAPPGGYYAHGGFRQSALTLENGERNLLFDYFDKMLSFDHTAIPPYCLQYYYTIPSVSVPAQGGYIPLRSWQRESIEQRLQEAYLSYILPKAQETRACFTSHI